MAGTVRSGGFQPPASQPAYLHLIINTLALQAAGSRRSYSQLPLLSLVDASMSKRLTHKHKKSTGALIIIG